MIIRGSRALLSIALILIAGSVALSPMAAHAGQYTVYNCRTADDAWAHNTDWVFTKGPFKSIDQISSDCPNGPFLMDMTGRKAHPANDYMHAWFNAPTDTQIVSWSIWRSVQLAYPFSYKYAENDNGHYISHDQCATWQGCSSKGSSNAGTRSTNLVQGSNPSGIDSLVLGISCDASGSSACPAKSPGARLQIHRFDVSLEDDQDPILESSPSGPVVDPSKPPLTGLSPVSLSATDRGGGVYQALFEVDGQIVDRRVIDRNGGNCQQPFDLPRPCKNSASGTVMFNTATVPDGLHSLRILVTDAAGNDAAYGPISIRTANASCTPFPPVNTLRMVSGFARGHKGHASVARHRKRGRQVVTVRYGRRASVNGQLLDPGAGPVPHAGVCVAEQPSMIGGAITPTTSFATDAQGQFSYRAAPGPSRTLFFVHRVAGGAIASSLKLNVRAPVKLKGSNRSLHNGQVLVLTGRLGEETYATPGLLVEMQAQRGRRHFQTFGTTHTNGSGEFRFSYRFTRTLGVQRYHLRAQIPAQQTYPFATGWSHPITVKVIGPGS